MNDVCVRCTIFVEPYTASEIHALFFAMQITCATEYHSELFFPIFTFLLELVLKFY